MYRIAVIGDAESVLSLKSIGFTAAAVENAAEAKQALKEFVRDDYAIVYLSEQFAAELAEELAAYAVQVRPAIILIPGREGSLGLGLENINKAVERAVGSNIL